jgi:hypothetical protein
MMPHTDTVHDTVLTDEVRPQQSIACVTVTPLSTLVCTVDGKVRPIGTSDSYVP